MYLKIQSKNEIEVEALSLMGASTKRGIDGKIGMFGTGNKYALATLLRNGIDVRIYSGKKLLKISKEPVELGGEVFERIVIDGHRTSITTSLGKDWKIWMAVRELYANALDEGNTVFDIRKSYPKGKEGFTSIYIEANNEILNFWMKKDEFFSKDRKPLYQDGGNKIFMKIGKKPLIYRKGILAVDMQEVEMTSIFDYDLENFQVDENRLAKYEYDVIQKIWELMYKCDDEIVIKYFLMAMQSGEKFYEFETRKGWYLRYPHLISDVWKNEFRDKKVCPSNLREFVKEEEVNETIFLHDDFYTDLVGILGNEIKRPESFGVANGVAYEKYEMTDEEAVLFEESLQFFRNADLKMNLPIEVVQFKKSNVLGMAYEGKILLGHRNFSRGVHEIVNTMIEEWIHLKHGVADETRGFQTAIIDEFVTYLNRFQK